MDHYQTLASNCHQTIEAIALLVDELAPPLTAAAELICEALLRDRKVLACGCGQDAALAQLFTLGMIGNTRRERPALPALNLGADGACIATVASQEGAEEVFARPLRALGQPGDVLLCVASSRAGGPLLRAIGAARERNMPVIALSNSADDALVAALHQDDVQIAINQPDPARVLELQTLAIQNLCEFIDQTLFGAYTGHTAP